MPYTILVFIFAGLLLINLLATCVTNCLRNRSTVQHHTAHGRWVPYELQLSARATKTEAWKHIIFLGKY